MQSLQKLFLMVVVLFELFYCLVLSLQAAYQNYLAFVSVQAAAINNQANSVLKKITMLLAITSPLNLIASVFGMNVFPLTQVSVVTGEEDNYMLFVVLLIVMLGSSFYLLCVAKYYRWW
jgi:Mg2+ and Co2+ transporter CorA|tara:strand:+ start:609 stop:965 length:357 start_codon:yes stop_codon:yes gene_type:complete